MTKTLNRTFVIIATMLLGMSCAEAQVNKKTLDQHADQSAGNYAATNLNYLGSGALGMTQSAWKDPLQHMGEGQSRPGYSKYYWSPDLVLPVRLREGMYTLINFPSWEVVEQVYLGDGTSFDAKIEGPSSLMVAPANGTLNLGVDTNMVVFGRSGNKYVFYVQSETVNTDRITNSIIDIEVVKKRGTSSENGFLAGSGSGGHVNAANYSGTDAADANFTRDLQREDWIEKIPVDPTKFRFDIEVYVPNPDDIIIAPERVWRDNIFTYIDLGEKALTSVQRPIVTLIVERSETPVGFRAAGPNNRLIIVEGMGDMVLRSGKRLVCLKLRRSDADGLENAVYAKTNEWDLQTAYASKTEGGEGQPAYEDVYGAADSNQSDSKSFFNTNSFVGETVPAERQSSNTGSVPGQGSQGLNINNTKDIETLPKVTTVVATPSDKSQEPVLTGQYDIKVNQQETIEPEYNNKTADIDVIYKGNSKSNKSAEEIINEAEKSGKLDNNSKVIIQGKETEKKNILMSKETEALLQEFRSGKNIGNTSNSNISIELGVDDDVNNLEKLWNDISKKYAATVGRYQPFYSIDAPADGQGRDVFHLRVGPIKSLEEGDNICSQMGLNGIFCSVVRTE